MFFTLLPIGVESVGVFRRPYVSIAIAFLTVTAFLFAWATPFDEERARPRFDDAYAYWQLHPYLDPPAEWRHFLPAQEWERVLVAHDQASAPTATELAEEQALLDRFERRVRDAAVEHRLGFVPARGPVQLGLFTHTLVHFGWMHLLANLLFFYITGLLLEDRWGRLAFPLFYVVGGAAAALTQYALDPSSQALMGGASGAVAACMGAFAVRFAAARIRLGYFGLLFIRPFWGSFALPAWVCGLAWGGKEVLALAFDDGQGGVALAAHVGGFVFGLGAAFALRWTGLERWLAPGHGLAYARSSKLDAAAAALTQGKLTEAERLYREALRASPRSLECEAGLIAVRLARRDAQAPAALERLFGRATANVGVLGPFIHALPLALGPTDVRPVVALRVGSMLGASWEWRELAEAWLVRAQAGDSVVAARALVAHAELLADSSRRVHEARALLARIDAHAHLPPDVTARLAKLRQRLPGQGRRSISLPGVPVASA